MIGMSTYQCGICCGKEIPCEKCLIDTLKSNGISLDYLDEIKGLKVESRGHSGHWARHYSELNKKLSEIIEQAKETT
jgi:hypothetical protein